MEDYEKSIKEHARTLVKEIKQKRAVVLSKRKKLIMNTEEVLINKQENYRIGLEYISDKLISALETYKEEFNNFLPEPWCDIKIKGKYPKDIDIIFTIKNHSIRFISRIANKGEEFQEVLVDGMLYVESTYQGSNRKMEAQAGLWSDIGHDAWECRNNKNEFEDFLKDILPDIIAFLWNNATLSFVHSKG